MGGCWCGGGVGGVDISSFLCFKMSPPLLNWCSFLSTKTVKRMMMMMMIIDDDDDDDDDVGHGYECVL